MDNTNVLEVYSLRLACGEDVKTVLLDLLVAYTPSREAVFAMFECELRKDEHIVTKPEVEISLAVAPDLEKKMAEMEAKYNGLEEEMRAIEQDSLHREVEELSEEMTELAVTQPRQNRKHRVKHRRIVKEIVEAGSTYSTKSPVFMDAVGEVIRLYHSNTMDSTLNKPTKKLLEILPVLLDESEHKHIRQLEDIFTKHGWKGKHFSGPPNRKDIVTELTDFIH
jgi:hypothetical protein